MSSKCWGCSTGAMSTGTASPKVVCVPVQLMVTLAVLLGRFKVTLAPQMGGWQGCHDREVNAFTLQLIGGNWLVFAPRDAAAREDDFLIRARPSLFCTEP